MYCNCHKNIVLSEFLPICELEYPRNPYEPFEVDLMEQNKRQEEKPLSLTYDPNNQTLENDAIIDVELDMQTLDAILEFEWSERTKDLSSAVL